ncbi:hypothetical protein [Fictibacillus enclensis]|uniref:hypothetical protein n=1 Tax=Fictibacillus enclensis TaxID=1017270 RepID=UPI0024BFA8EA|nr:hypothetical protein [Fictibacillus enclensis]WHY70184.1 hypothetical protein QNH15_13975 [Fictibacillus enclensis]
MKYVAEKKEHSKPAPKPAKKPATKPSTSTGAKFKVVADGKQVGVFNVKENAVMMLKEANEVRITNK